MKCSSCSMTVSNIVNLFSLSSCFIGAKGERLETEGRSRLEHAKKLREEYAETGTRRTVEAVMLVYDHRHPHVLLLQPDRVSTDDATDDFLLPCGQLRPGEDEEEGMKRILSEWCGEPGRRPPLWEVRHNLGSWWRPNFAPTHYPYLPPHITKPKEQRKLLLVELPEYTRFFIPAGYQLVAAPLFEIFGNKEKYGPVLASLPQILSRFTFTFLGKSQ